MAAAPDPAVWATAEPGQASAEARAARGQAPEGWVSVPVGCRSPLWRTRMSPACNGYAQGMKLLVVTSEAITAQQLHGAVPVDADPKDIEVMVLAPALSDSGVRFWFSDADDAIQRAQAVSRESVQELEGSTASAQGTTGESDPAQAIIDALQTFPADRIVLFTHGRDDEQRYREDVDVEALRERVGVPIDRAPVGS